jgi:hypothetical protein
MTRFIVLVPPFYLIALSLAKVKLAAMFNYDKAKGGSVAAPAF